MFIITIIWAGEFVALFLFWLQAAELRKDKKKEVKTTNHLFFLTLAQLHSRLQCSLFWPKQAKQKQSKASDA